MALNLKKKSKIPFLKVNFPSESLPNKTPFNISKHRKNMTDESEAYSREIMKLVSAMLSREIGFNGAHKSTPDVLGEVAAHCKYLLLVLS